MDPTAPRQDDQGFAEPDGLAYDPGTPRWRTLGGGDGGGPGDAPVAVPDEQRADGAAEPEASSPGPRRAAFGVILGVLAGVVGVLAQLAGFGVVVWLAVAVVAVAAVMVGQGYRQWRADADR